MSAPRDSATEPTAPSSHGSEPVDVGLPQSLHSAVYARRSEYVRPHRVHVKIGTWNVAGCPGTDHDLASWFVSGRGVDRRLSTVDAARNRAVERETTGDSLVEEEDANAIRLVGGDKIGLYVLGLQEVVDLNVMSRVYSDAAAPVLDKWKTAIEVALPDGYELVASEQMSGLLLLVYASPEIAPTLSHASTSVVGTGLLGLMGNKGAVSARIILGESTRMAFVNSHLASGNDPSYLDRRCWDVAQIEGRTQFEPFNHPGVPETTDPEKLGDEDFAFWFGDLNFRLDLPGDDIRRLLTLHTRGEYGITISEGHQDDNDPIDGEDAVVLRNAAPSDKSSYNGSTADPGSVLSTGSSAADGDVHEITESMRKMPPLPDPDEFLPDPADDPASLQATLDSLLPHDQLRRVIAEHKAFHNGWREGHITFLPSYKYDVGTVGLFDSSEKRRAPSWCDRILYRTRKNKEDYELKVQEEAEAKRKDEEMKARGLADAAEDEDVLFEYQPDQDGDLLNQDLPPAPTLEYDEYDDTEDNAVEPEEVVTQEGYVDRIQLDIYTSHQRIQSSDHKPVVSVFTIDYDAVVPELKAKVHAEVVKELDRAENEGKPGVTIVVDSHFSAPASRDPTSGDAVDFGPVEFLQKTTASLTIANTGGVPAVFSFAQKPTIEDLNASGSSPVPYQWLTCTFVPSERDPDGLESYHLGYEVTLEPGETVNVLLDILVDDLTFARMLNDGDTVLEDVLVLRVVDGRDHFIPVHGHWAPTCIGRSLEELIRVPDGGIRAFFSSRLKKTASQKNSATSGSIPYELDVQSTPPKDLIKLMDTIEHLAERVLADDQMLGERKIPSDKLGWPFEDPVNEVNNSLAVAVIDALDNDRPVQDAFESDVPALQRLEVASSVLLLYLSGLTDGIITIPLWTQIDQEPLFAFSKTSPTPSGSFDDDKNTILEILLSALQHYVSFVFLTDKLSRVIDTLSTLSPADAAALQTPPRKPRGGLGAAFGSIGRRSFSSFKKTSGTTGANGAAALAAERRLARERRYAEIFGRILCRAPVPAKEKEKKALEDRQRAVVEVFLRAIDANVK